MVIKTEKLTKYYKKTRGIEDLSLEIKKGEIFGLLGPNGAGKTTTIRMLMGMIRPTGGSATVKGIDCWNQSPKVKAISAYIAGDTYLYPKETGNSMINIYGGIRKNKKLAKELVERFDFDPTKKIKALSRGNRQKLAIILAFMFEPEVVILDEPTSGLDPLMQQEFYALLKEVQAKGVTIFMSSHFLPEIEKVCERVGIVKDGNLVGIEEVSELAAKHVRILNVTFETKPDLSKYKIPEIIEIKHLIGNDYEMKIVGRVDPIIKALSKDKIKDLSFTHASLEEVFLEYYS